MPPSLKYAVVERERRFLVRDIPSGVREAREIVDRYLIDTRLRLREVVAGDGTVTRKLGQKIRLAGGAAEIAHTSLYLDDGEWTLLCLLPAMVLRKTRHVVERDDLRVVVDELPGGTLLAEIDDGEQPSGWCLSGSTSFRTSAAMSTGPALGSPSEWGSLPAVPRLRDQPYTLMSTVVP